MSHPKPYSNLQELKNTPYSPSFKKSIDKTFIENGLVVDKEN